MNKSKWWYILVAFVVLLPSVIGFVYYKSVEHDPIRKDTVKSLKMITPDGNEFVCRTDAEDEQTGISQGNVDKNLISFFLDLNSRAESIPELPEIATEDCLFRVVYGSFNRNTEYNYYFTNNSQYAYYTDHTGKPYRISELDAVAFLSSNYASCLYHSSAAPNLTVASAPVPPTQMTWQYISFNSEYVTADTETASGPIEVTSRTGLALSFDREPDYVNVQVKDGEQILFDNIYELLPGTLFAEDKDYTVTLNAKWYQNDRGTNAFGEAKYEIRLHALAPAVFYLNTNTIDPGEFAVIFAKNVPDPSKVRFSSEPAIGFVPEFHAYGDGVLAFVPISIALDPIAKQYTFTLSYEGAEQQMQLNINDKTFKAQTSSASLSLIASSRNETALAEYEAFLARFAKGTDTQYFDDSRFVPAAKDCAVRCGFGLYMTLAENGEEYRHDGVDYVVYSTEYQVSAAMRGKVVFCGELAYLGKTIVIDHGFGLVTVYGHLSQIRVSEGMEVAQSAVIGIVGKTGFTDTLTVHYGMLVGGVPVSPYRVQDYGLMLSQE